MRIIRGARTCGVETVAIYSTADRDALHVRMADRALCIGPPRAAESYLNESAIVAAAIGSKCDALHPGYGFLAENASFAALCEENGVQFVGPTSEAVATMGNKIRARETARRVGVPTIPGTQAELAANAAAQEAAKAIGFPLLLKAAAGGGGRGMRVVRAPDELASAFSEASAEAQAAFGNGSLYAERFLEGVRHIEIQVLSDGAGSHLHLGERDCTLQRRSQKLLEEAPSDISTATRVAMGEAAIMLARNIGYRSAGTVEFVYDPKTEEFFFLEMNTRIQVEHPVTEAVTGVDIVAEQLRVASGEGLSLTQADIALSGHAIECRINAEDPEANFHPMPGRITRWKPPSGEGIRVDSHVFEGYVIPPFYDSMIAKLIVTASTRRAAIEKMRGALEAFEIEGVPTTRAFHLRVLADPRFAANAIDTKWIEREFLSVGSPA
ncbi:MAG: acetyl-CoA carboxylase biotin carboxylase subunit [Vulcanimicrobiaceae bacterium]